MVNTKCLPLKTKNETNLHFCWTSWGHLKPWEGNGGICMRSFPVGCIHQAVPAQARSKMGTDITGREEASQIYRCLWCIIIAYLSPRKKLKPILLGGEEKQSPKNKNMGIGFLLVKSGQTSVPRLLLVYEVVSVTISHSAAKRPSCDEAWCII